MTKARSYMYQWHSALLWLVSQTRRVVYGVLLSAALGATCVTSAQPVGLEAEALSKVHAAPPAWGQQAYSLRTMGIKLGPLTPGPDGYTEIYFPVPAGILLNEVQLTFKARYLMDDFGAQLQLVVDGEPVVTRSFNAKEGLIDISLPLDSQARQSGFVRVGINWLPTRILQACEVAPPSSSALLISDETHISYRYKVSSSFPLKSAWGAMAPNPLLMVSGEANNSTPLDAGWRVATALQAAGKRVKVGTFPSIGNIVDTENIKAPEAFADHTIFKSIRNAGSQFKIETEAQIGALMVLGARQAIGDVVIVDDNIRKKIDSALDALKTTVAQDDVATKAIDAWRDKFLLANNEKQSADIWVSFAGEHPVLAIRAQAGAQAAGLLSDTWRQILTSSYIHATTALPYFPQTENKLRLSTLGASFGSFAVTNQGHWTTAFALGAVSADGRMPTRVALDVAVAPDSSKASAVVSVLLNDTLLTAARVRADGEPQRISARIPGYALRLNNKLRVEVQRQTTATGCTEPIKGYPVSVLPTSYLELGKAQPDGTFIGLLPLLAGPLDLIVPDTWPKQAKHRIPEIVSLAMASGMSPVHTQLVLAPASEHVQPSNNFVAMNVPVHGVQSKVKVVSSEKITVGKQNVTWLDVSGTQDITAIEVARSGPYQGLLWQSDPESSAAFSGAYVLDRGDVALIGSTGPIAWIDSTNPDSNHISDAADTAFYEWRHYLSWGVPLASILALFFVIVLALAYKAGRRRTKK